MTPKPTVTQEPPKGPVRFRQGVVTTDSTTSVSISPDGKALTITFSNLEATLNNGGSTSLDGTRKFRVDLPLTDGAHSGRVSFYANGYAFTQGATARLILHANGHQVIRDFPEGTDDEYEKTLGLPAFPRSVIHLSVILEIHPVQGFEGPAGYLNVLSLDAQFT